MKQVIKIVIAAFMFIAAPQFAAAQKIAHINRDSLIRIMPDYQVIKDSLAHQQIALETQANSMLLEYQRKKRERDSLEGKKSPLILAVMDNDLAALEQRYMDFAQLADQELLNLQVALITPLMKKVDDAIAAVAKEKGYAYVLDSSEGSNVLYSRPEDDIFLAVCAKLKVTPPAPKPAPSGAPAPGGAPAPAPK